MMFMKPLDMRQEIVKRPKVRTQWINPPMIFNPVTTTPNNLITLVRPAQVSWDRERGRQVFV